MELTAKEMAKVLTSASDDAKIYYFSKGLDIEDEYAKDILEFVENNLDRMESTEPYPEPTYIYLNCYSDYAIVKMEPAYANALISIWIPYDKEWKTTHYQTADFAHSVESCVCGMAEYIFGVENEEVIGECFWFIFSPYEIREIIKEMAKEIEEEV
jgi:hypothetical protein